MTIIIDYIILFYGIGTPLFYAVYKFTVARMEKRQRKALQLDDELPKYTPKEVKTQINIVEQKYIRMKETIENDNISANDRITILKSVIKKK